MNIREMIVKAPNEGLNQKCQMITAAELKKGNLKNILIEMKKFVADEKNGAAGLALPQVGINKRAFVATIKQGEEYVTEIFINPIVKPTGFETTEGVEGCLSIDEKVAVVKRHDGVEVYYKGLNGNPRTKNNVPLKLKGWNARVIQHENDHLNGILITDIGQAVDKRVLENIK